MINNEYFTIRHFGMINWLGLWTLIQRENARYLSIWQQTVFAPLTTAGLFFLVFSISIGPNRADVHGVPYLTFLAPGLLMMTVIQNAFANTSSSLLTSKITGNIVDSLMPPLSPLELTIGFISGGVGRALMLGVTLGLGMGLGLGIWIKNPFWILAFILFGSIFMSALGIIGGIYAQKFDQMSAITNFIITPLSFLSGTFYSIAALPAGLQHMIIYNPMYYIIDGGRYGSLLVSDGPPIIALLWVIGAAFFSSTLAWWLLKTGYGLKF